MKQTLLSIHAAVLIAAGVFFGSLLQAAEAGKPRTKAEFEAAARLQVFLDRAEFAPGKIDGRYGEFTVKALALYRQAHGLSAPAVPEKPDPRRPAPPDVTGLDLSGVEPLFLTYTVTAADLEGIGELPDSVPAQAKQKALPYQSAAEAIAEKFHTDVDFLAELNPGKTSKIQAGDTLTVPNVQPFEIATVRNLKPGSEVTGPAANDVDEEAEPPKTAKKEKEPAVAIPTTSVKIDTATNMLAVYDGEKLIAAYPVTIGSAQTESPVGEWKVRGVARMPNFRYDKSMLNKGERSGNFHMLPPGPNNPVGVIWIQLNKKGIGLHGTSDPDAIGRSASHGCVRLANWDVVRLAGKVAAGVPVSIR